MTQCTFATPLNHPGPPLAQRRISVPTASRAVSVSLPAGPRLIDALDTALAGLGVTCAQVELLDGTLSRVSYCYPALVEDGSAAVGYSSTKEAVVPARLVAGSVTVGFRAGQRFIHCHAAWFDGHGTLRGGHLWPETSIGPGPVQAIIHALDSVETTSATDPESTLPVFTPRPRASHGLPLADTRRAVMTRLAPGVDLTTAVADIMAEHGFAKATIGGTLGSLVGAVLRREGSVLVVDGPATEVTLNGHFDATAGGEPVVSAIAIDRFGTVHTGLLIPGENLVAVTAELLVEEVRW